MRQIENSGSPRSATESRRTICGHVSAIVSAEKPSTSSANSRAVVAWNNARSSGGSGSLASFTRRATVSRLNGAIAHAKLGGCRTNQFRIASTMTASTRGRHDVRIEMRIPAIRRLRSSEKCASVPMARRAAARTSAARAFFDEVTRAV
jgi:hypothetical protein